MRDKRLFFDRIEDTIYEEYRHDSIVVMALGYVLLCVGLSVFMWPGLWWAQISTVVILSVPLIIVAKLRKQYIIYPRLGYAQTAFRPSARRVARTARTIMLRGFLLMFLFMLAFHYAWKFPRFLGSAPHIPSGKEADWPPFEDGNFISFVSVIFSFLYFDLKGITYWSTAVFAMCAVALASYFQINVGWAIASIGTLLVGIGILRLRRFLRENPRVEETDAE